jgi:microcystin-dependent protein
MADPYIGEIRTFGFDFAPRGWALCNGAILPINQNQALFSLLGTYYGGNGSTNFALPDLRSRVPLGMGQGTAQPGNFSIGQQGGAATVTLTTAQLPAHNHPVNASDHGGNDGPVRSPEGHVLERGNVYADAPDGKTVMNAGMIGNTGGGQPVSILPPYLALNFCIALQGIYPPRQ